MKGVLRKKPRCADGRNRSAGWHVRINHRGVAYTRWFADTTQGGKERAHERALAWREQAIKKIRAGHTAGISRSFYQTTKGHPGRADKQRKEAA